MTDAKRCPRCGNDDNDRDRRIRELALKWGENMTPETAIGSLMSGGGGFLLDAAAKFIDAIDAAVIPPKGEKVR